MRDWLIWLVVGVGLAVAELLSLDFVLIMLAAGALAAAAAAGLGAEVVVQGVVFALVSALALFLVRPIARRHVQSAPATPMRIEALPGREVLVLEQVGPDTGLVKIDGEHWTARPFEAGQVLEPGETAEVITIRGATALVWRKN
jgi:membrane protein implicated in regulation of membrane protease activity